jgi:SNF2 family DNA or RNA helicase
MSLDLIQSVAIEKLSRLKAGALFMHMGTGKTRVACELIKSKTGYFNEVAWLAPASLIRESSYHDEIKMRLGDLYGTVQFFTIEGVSQSDRKFLQLKGLAESSKVFCVIDESLAIKNLASSRTKRLLKMGNAFSFRLLLNGTPVSRSLLDLYTQIEFLSPKILNMTEAQFAYNFLSFKREGHRPWARWSRPENEQALIEMIRPYIFDTALDIDASLTTQHVDFDLSDCESGVYKDLKNELLEKSSFNGSLDFLQIAQKLQSQYTLCGEKYEWLQELMANPKKTIIFVKFIKELDEVKEVIPDVLEYSGRQKDDLSLFTKGNCPVLVMTYGTGGKGLNLQAAERIVFLGQTFDFAQKEHALHRCYRVGQTKDVEAIHCWVNTGLEKLIRYSLTRKSDLSVSIKHFIETEGVEAL